MAQVNNDVTQPQLEMPTNVSSIEAAIAGAMYRCAPLYEAEGVLKDWLAQNGVQYHHVGSGWVLMDNRKGYRGIMIAKRLTYPEILACALDQVKQFLIHDANVKGDNS